MSHRFTLSLTALASLAVAACGGGDRTDWGQPWNPTGFASAGQDGGDESSEEDDGAGEEETTADPTNADDSAGDETTALTSAGESTGELGESTGMIGPPPSPYQGGWDIGTCQETVSSSIPDMSLTDQYGDSVRLYDFCHKAILLVGGAFW